MFIPNNSTVPKLQTAEDLQGDALLHYDAEMELMNLILLSIPNDIYNSVDACTSAKDMWKRVERLMRGTIQNKVDRETHFTNEFDHIFEKLVNVLRAKKLEKSHDPLALVAQTGSSSRNTSSYYVTHPTFVVDYEDEYQQDDVHTNSEDPLASAMLLLARAITQNFSTLTNNRLRTSSNTRNQAIIQGDRVNIQSRNSGNAGRNNRRAYVQEEIVEGSNAPNETGNVQRTLRTSSSGNTSTVQCYNCSGKGHYARNCPKPRVRDSKYFMEQMLLAKQDEAGVILTDEQNDFLFADASRMEEIEELSANICLMARIQPADNTSDVGPSYDSAFIMPIGDDQIDSDIIFDSPNGNVNSGSIEKDTHVPDLWYLNPYTLKQAISQCLSYYLPNCLGNSEISLKVRDNEDTLDDASKSQQKRGIKEMKDVFESTESELCELEKQNDFLKDQLLEVSLKHEVELSGLQARIKILEKDVQRCEKQSVDFELKLQHEKEKHKWDSNLKNKNTNPLDYSWISKMEKLEDENVSLDFTVQSLIKERDNVKLEYQKLFNSIKKTRSQTQTKMDELTAHVSEKTYAYGAIRAKNRNLLFTISELKTRLANVEKGKSVNTKFDKTNGSQPLLCVTPLNKHVIQKKTDVQKLEEKHVMSKPATLQTSLGKQRGVNLNKNVIAPGMYKVITTHKSQTNEAKHDLTSTGMNTASSVRRPMNRDSHVKNSVLANSKKPAKKVVVYVRKNKQTDNTSENVISNKENVIDVDVANAFKAKTLLCVSCMQNVLIPCHDNCFANYKLNVHSNVRRTLSTKSRTSKSYDTTYVAHKTRFSKESTLSKSLDTTYVVSNLRFDVVQIVLWIVDSGCSKHMMGDRSLLKNFIEKFMGTVRFGNDNFAAITGYGDYIQGNITICYVYYVEGLGHNLFSVGQFCDGDLEVAFHSKTCYVRNLKGDDLLTGGRESNLYTISISDMSASSPVCLMSKATSTKSWLWH
ncbi:retrovirus-related pol polyprotein from transposon TNT 1-94 [Tanacetum coccineum]|uniref:Retrovirus-related pol polyprotein from transposon TNT 1-94 n=1 Tax=Tanacetum coccineum TaxID=301880 RepID=A0ABQ4Y028_9ASTR